MHDADAIWPTNMAPGPETCAATVEACRATFRRTLAGWASDVLHLRRRGELRPTWRSPAGLEPDRAAA